MPQPDRIVLLVPARQSHTVELLMGHRKFRRKGYVETYSVAMDSISLDGWGAQQVAEYLMHLSIAGKLPVPICYGTVLEMGGKCWMFVNDALSGSSLTMDYMPLPAWDHFGLVALQEET